MSQIQTEIYPDGTHLAAAVASNVVKLITDAVADHGYCTIALAGGSTPKRLYTVLASDPFRDQIPWDRLYLFLGDERYVPNDHPDSNFRMAREALLDHVQIPESQIFPVQTELDPDKAAAAYEQRLREVFELQEDSIPSFDLILLGIGGDGHTASLFPDTAALEVHDRLVVENHVPQQDAMRITFTIPLLQSAAAVILLATGDDKADAIARAVHGEPDVNQTPSQILREASGTVTFALDESAAAGLST
jgi:6-phosphogluconolactonase